MRGKLFKKFPSRVFLTGRFLPAFFKKRRSGGAELSSRSAERETFLRRFFFISFFLCASCVKEKSG